VQSLRALPLLAHLRAVPARRTRRAAPPPAAAAAAGGARRKSPKVAHAAFAKNTMSKTSLRAHLHIITRVAGVFS
jgi:hypothetical protein